MKKKLIKRLIIKDILQDKHITKWVIEYWMDDEPNNDIGDILTTMTISYLVPSQYEQLLEGTKMIRRIKDKVLLQKIITVPESVFNSIHNNTPSQMEIKMIKEKGGVLMVRKG